jgi:hypothetical protein
VKNIHVDINSRIPPSTNNSASSNYVKLKHIFRSKEEVKMQWLQNTKTINVDNRNNEERETSSHCRMKGQEYLIGNIKEF